MSNTQSILDLLNATVPILLRMRPEEGKNSVPLIDDIPFGPLDSSHYVTGEWIIDDDGELAVQPKKGSGAIRIRPQL
jgi:hypothetical protein